MKSILQNYIAHIRLLVSTAGKRTRIAFLAFAGLLVIGALGSVWTLNNNFSVEVPTSGGKITEGVIGTPRFINPVLATSDVDRDLTALVYSGLMRRAPDGVSFIPDLAENYSVSEDGKTYTFTIRENAKFQNGKSVTADDVAFTIEKIQDSTMKSPWRIQWVDIKTQVTDARTIAFTLEKPYAGFLLATTVGILPKSIWAEFSGDAFQFSKYNTHPVGSGPYRVTRVRTKSDGTPTSYNLSRFKRFVLSTPHIPEFTFKFYPNENELLAAFENKSVANIHAFPAEYAETIRRQDIVIREVALPRVFAMFFNQSKNRIFLEKPVMDAMHLAIDREGMIRTALQGFGTAIDGPIPSAAEAGSAAKAALVQDFVKANEILDRAGWKKNEATGIREKSEKTGVTRLSFTLSTADTPDLVESAGAIKTDLAKIGIGVEVRLFGLGNLDRDVIRPREYEALLFGQVLRYDTDLYAFWHSSQRNDPGLNVALYANRSVDDLLEQALAESDSAKRLAIYEKVSGILKSDAPALFPYSPHMLFTFDRDLTGNEQLEATQESNRFLFAHEWYMKTDRVWKFLAPSD